MRALILVDVQRDFMPGGALAVPEGNLVVPVANRLLPHFPLVVATQDWHPPDHGSFASQHAGKRVGDVIELDGLEQVLWPDHCVQGTPGAALHEGLDQRTLARVFQKGTERQVDSYSGFFDNGHRKATGLAEYLRERGVDQVAIMGLATDYCVKFTALDARALGFRTQLIEDGCRAVAREPGDRQRALDQLQAEGVELLRAEQVTSRG